MDPDLVIRIDKELGKGDMQRDMHLLKAAVLLDRSVMSTSEYKRWAEGPLGDYITSATPCVGDLPLAWRKDPSTPD